MWATFGMVRLLLNKHSHWSVYRRASHVQSSKQFGWRRSLSYWSYCNGLLCVGSVRFLALLSFTNWSKPDQHFYRISIPMHPRKLTGICGNRFGFLLRTVNSGHDLKSFFYRSALLWNTLPHDIQCVKEKQIFKCDLETHWSEHKYCPYKNIDIP